MLYWLRLYWKFCEIYFYESHIAMLVQSYTEDIIRGNKNVNEILLSDNKTILELKKYLKRENLMQLLFYFLDLK